MEDEDEFLWGESHQTLTSQQSEEGSGRGQLIPGQELGFNFGVQQFLSEPTPALALQPFPSSASSSSASLMSFPAPKVEPEEDIAFNTDFIPAVQSTEGSPTSTDLQTQRCHRCSQRITEMKATLNQRCQEGALRWERNWKASGLICFGVCDSNEFCTEHGYPLNTCISKYSAMPGIKHAVFLYQGTWIKLRRKHGQPIPPSLAALHQDTKPTKKRLKPSPQNDQQLQLQSTTTPSPILSLSNVLPMLPSSIFQANPINQKTQHQQQQQQQQQQQNTSSDSSPSTNSPFVPLSDNPLSPQTQQQTTTSGSPIIILPSTTTTTTTNNTNSLPPIIAAAVVVSMHPSTTEATPITTTTATPNHSRQNSSNSNNRSAVPGCNCAERLSELLLCSWVRGIQGAEDKLTRHLNACEQVCQGFCKTSYCCRLHWCPAFVLKDGSTGSKYHCQGGSHLTSNNKGRHHADYCYYCDDKNCCGGKWFSRDETHKRTTTKRRLQLLQQQQQQEQQNITISPMTPAVRVSDINQQSRQPSAPPINQTNFNATNTTSPIVIRASITIPNETEKDSKTATKPPPPPIERHSTNENNTSSSSSSENSTAIPLRVPPPKYSQVPEDQTSIIELYPLPHPQTATISEPAVPQIHSQNGNQRRFLSKLSGSTWILPVMTVSLAITIAALLCCIVFVSTLSVENQRMNNKIQMCWSLSYRQTTQQGGKGGGAGGEFETFYGCSDCAVFPDRLNCLSSLELPVVLEVNSLFSIRKNRNEDAFTLYEFTAATNFSDFYQKSEIDLPFAFDSATSTAVNGWEDSWYAFISK